MEQRAWSGREAGATLVLAAAGTIFAMGHHPSGLHGAGAAGAVHGAMIALLAALAFGFASFSAVRGARRPLVLAGLVAYAMGLIGHVGAATINGFIVPALAARGEAIGHDVFLAAWEANQALAKLGVYAAAAAYLLWSLDLLRGPDGEARALGGAGLLAALVPAGLLASGAIGMNVSGAMLVYGAQVLWAALVGVQLWRGRLG